MVVEVWWGVEVVEDSRWEEELEEMRRHGGIEGDDLLRHRRCVLHDADERGDAK